MQGRSGRRWGVPRIALFGVPDRSESTGRIAILEPIEASDRQCTIREKHWVPSIGAALAIHECMPYLYD